MIAERAYGKTRKITVLAALEMFKALCRVKISYNGLDLAQRGRSVLCWVWNLGFRVWSMASNSEFMVRLTG
jgi:hypothetical protein